jgi:hypothetical protein
MESLRDSDWRRLIRMIQDGTCVLFLGPGIETDSQNARDTPLTVTLARTLATRLTHPEDLGSRDDLAHVAQLFQHQNDRIELEMVVEDFYRSYTGQTTSCHRQLAALPFQLCIDITHAGFLEAAFRDAGKVPVQDFYWFRQQRTPSLAPLTPARPGIYSCSGVSTPQIRWSSPKAICWTSSSMSRAIRRLYRPRCSAVSRIRIPRFYFSVLVFAIGTSASCSIS